MKTIRLLILLAGVGLAATAGARTIEMTVNGLVCAFCAQGIEKTLRRNPATADVVVSLEHRLVAVETRGEADIPDETLRTALRDAGYDVRSIARTERTMAEIREALREKK